MSTEIYGLFLLIAFLSTLILTIIGLCIIFPPSIDEFLENFNDIESDTESNSE